MQDKLKYIIVGILLIIAFLLYKSYGTLEEIKENQKIESPVQESEMIKRERNDSDKEISNFDSKEIDELTSEEVVVAHLKKKKELPKYYITKKEARKNGWIPSKGNLCEVLPKHAIGGDYFSNREGNLPKQNGRKYYEADINYNCGRRGKDRLVFSNDGLIYVTYNHYNSFEKR